MSLLMQALKKAENAKQKQGDQSTDSVAVTPEVVTPPSELESLPLTLQPQEPSLDEQKEASAAAQEATSVTTSALDYFATAQPEPSQPTRAEQQAALEADSGLTPKPVDTPLPPAAAVPQATPNVSPAKETAVGGGTHGKLKIGLDEKQSAAIEAKKKLTARNAAKSVFDAKQKSPNRRAIVMGLLGLIILGAVGAYGYINITGIGQTPLTNVIAIAPPPVTETAPGVAPPADPTARINEIPSALPAIDSTNAGAESLPTTSSAGTASMPGTTTVAVIPQNQIATTTPQANTYPTTAMSSAAPAMRMPGNTASTAPPSAQPQLSTMSRQSDAIQIRRTDASLQLNPTLSSAYQAYMAGDLSSANSQYQKVLQQEPNNRDALLGIAAIAINRGQNAQAGSFYNRLLILDPNDAEASAGIASLDQNDPSRAESRLKNILAKNPNSGSTLFALGNVYAEQSRWSEAQQFYFRAFGAASGNADYAYNLAISLDKLDQARLALEYYQRALQLSQKNGGNLDKTTVINRIQALQSMPQT